MLEKTLLGTACAAALMAAPSAHAEELTVVSFGGSYQDAESKALFQPAAKALGI
ncbi:MAG: ABC transporter substrate-binding protein, partial [Alphaproteobacteria bacterium]|nr:ABC transporter substrate-binding protein [Alphaproteobacteria bacterium]